MALITLKLMVLYKLNVRQQILPARPKCYTYLKLEKRMNMNELTEIKY